MKNQQVVPMLFLFLLFTTTSIGWRGKRMVPVTSSVVFSIQNAGLEVNGTISGIEADIAFDPENLAHGYIKAIANPATINTGINIRDKHLQRSDYFDVENYPKIFLTSKVLRKKGKNRFTGLFWLTMKGITKEITIPFTRNLAGNSPVYRGSFEVNRLDFALGEKSLILDEKIKVNIQVQVD